MRIVLKPTDIFEYMVERCEWISTAFPNFMELRINAEQLSEKRFNDIYAMFSKITGMPLGDNVGADIQGAMAYGPDCFRIYSAFDMFRASDL